MEGRLTLFEFILAEFKKTAFSSFPVPSFKRGTRRGLAVPYKPGIPRDFKQDCSKPVAGTLGLTVVSHEPRTALEPKRRAARPVFLVGGVTLLPCSSRGGERVHHTAFDNEFHRLFDGQSERTVGIDGAPRELFGRFGERG